MTIHTDLTNTPHAAPVVDDAGEISIWFFIGLSLLGNGILILGAGIWQMMHPPENPGTVLFNLHANTWWGLALLIAGIFYCVKFLPRFLRRR